MIPPAMGTTGAESAGLSRRRVLCAPNPEQQGPTPLLWSEGGWVEVASTDEETRFTGVGKTAPGPGRLRDPET